MNPTALPPRSVAIRPALMIGTALGSALVVLGAGQAVADDECGVPAGGVVTCTVSGGPYTAGVAYASAGAISVQADGALSIEGPLQISAVGTITVGSINGPLISASAESGDAMRFTAGSAIEVTVGDAASADGRGVYALSDTGGVMVRASDVSGTTGGVHAEGVSQTQVWVDNVSIAADGTAGTRAIGAYGQSGAHVVVSGNVTAVGDYAAGIDANGGDSGAVVQVGGAVSTSGYGARALFATAAGDVVVHAGRVVTTGDDATGVQVVAGGDVSAQLGTVETEGVDAIGVAVEAGGSVNVIASEVTTSGDGGTAVYIEAEGAITLEATTVRTTGEDASGLVLQSRDGAAVDLSFGHVQTSGGDSEGVVLQALYGGNLTVAADDGAISTAGVGAVGLEVLHEHLGDPEAPRGQVVIDVGSIQTRGNEAHGVSLQAAGGASVTVGSITTGDSETGAGNGADGVHVRQIGGDLAVRVGQVTTHGDQADGVDVDLDSESNDPVAVDVVVGAVTTSGRDSRGVHVRSAGATTVAAGSVATDGRNADAVRIDGQGQGSARITATGAIVTQQARSSGVTVIDADTTTIEVADVTTHGEYSAGVRVEAQGAVAGAATVTARDVVTHGADSFGIRATAQTGAVAVAVRDVVTHGDRSSGVSASAVGEHDVRIVTRDVRTDGVAGTGVRASTEAGNIAVTAQHVIIGGSNATGVTASSSAGGDVTLNLRRVAATGSSYNIGVSLATVGADTTAALTAAEISTTGANSQGVLAASTGFAVLTLGDWEGRTGGVSTRGDRSTGVAFSGLDADGAAAGSVDLQASSISTAGVAAHGARISGAAEAAVRAQRVATSGAGAHGMWIEAEALAVDVQDVAVTGAGSHGVLATGLNGEASEVSLRLGQVSATGEGARGVLAAGAEIDLDVLRGLQGSVAAAELTALGAIDVVIETGAEVVGGEAALRLDAGAGTTVVNRGAIRSNGYALEVRGGPAGVVNAGLLSGRVALTDSGDTLANSGQFYAYGQSDFGGGADLLENGGVLTIGRAEDEPMTATFVNLERLDNLGVIDLANGRAGDRLVLEGGVLRGFDGSRIQMDLDLTGSTPAADLLTVGALEGVNAVELHVQGRGAVGETGVTLIASGAAQAGDEVEVTTIGGGFLDFNAVYDAASREFRVTAAAARQAFEPTKIASGAQTQWRRGADVVSARFDELRDSGAMGLRRGGTAQFWAQGFAGSEEVNGERRFSEDGTESVDLTHDVDARGAQFGVDIVRGLGGGDLVLGLSAGVGETELTFQSNGDTAEFSGGGVGAYAHWSSGPLAVGVQAKADRYDLDYRFVSADLRDSADGETVGARVDASWRMPATGDWIFESQGSLAWTDTDLGGIEGEAGEVEFGDTRSVLARAGVRLARAVRLDSGAVVQPFVGVHRLHELDGENASRIHLNNQILDVTDPGRGTWTQFTAGANVGVGAVQGFAQGEATLGDVRGYTARVGVRLNW